MLVLFITFWTISAILIGIDPRDKTMRWSSAAIGSAGCGALGIVLREQALPAFAPTSPAYAWLIWLIGILFTISINFGPYLCLMFGMSYSGLPAGKWAVWKKRVTWFCLIPPSMMGFIYPIVPYYEPSYLVMSIWAVPYFLAATFCLFHAYVHEKDAMARQQRLLTLLVLTPFVLFSMMTNYVLHIFGIKEAWRFGPWLLIHFFFLFVFFSIKYGFMGVRLKFEKHFLYSRMTGSMRTQLTDGASTERQYLESDMEAEAGERQIRVLVIDDDQPRPDSIPEMISAEPDLVLVDVIDNIRGALERINETGVDVVLLNLHLGGDAAGSLQAIHDLKQKTTLKIIVLFSGQEIEPVIAAYDAGAAYCIDRQDVREIPARIREIHFRKNLPLDILLAELKRRKEELRLRSLTPMERKVYDLKINKKTNKQIAQELHIEIRTVKNHLNRSYKKLK